MNKVLEEILTARVRGILAQLVFEVKTEHYDFNSDSIDKAQKDVLEALKEFSNETISIHKEE